MPLPVPRNCRLNEKEGGIDFEVEIDGKKWKAFITFEALDFACQGQDRIRALSRSSFVAGQVAKLVRDRDDGDPIVLTSEMLRKKVQQRRKSSPNRAK